MSEFNRVLLVLHPATRIALWLLFAIAVSWSATLQLVALTVPLVGWLAWWRGPRFPRMLRRARWLLLSLLLIYGLATPGEALFPWELGPNPTREGLILGFNQAWRIALMLGALALLLESTAPADLVAGLLVLMRPMRGLGVAPERVALRLCLTLQYASEIGAEVRRDWRAAWDSAAQSGASDAPGVIVELPRFSWRDAAALGASAAVLLLGFG